MAELKVGVDGYQVQEFKVSIEEVGRMNVEMFWFGCSGKTQATIQIRKAQPKSFNSTVIFEGTLAELIERLTTANIKMVDYDEVLEEVKQP